MLAKVKNQYSFLPNWYIERIHYHKIKKYRTYSMVLFIIIIVTTIYMLDIIKEYNNTKDQYVSLPKINAKNSLSNSKNTREESLIYLLGLEEEGYLNSIVLNNNTIEITMEFKDKYYLENYINKLKAYKNVKIQDIILDKHRESYKFKFQLSVLSKE